MVVVFADGPDFAPPVRVPAGAFVIAADGGAERARELGVRVDLVVGDLDSLAPRVLEELEGTGARVERHPVAKDASDLELALECALARDPARIVVVGGAGGRLDQLAGELLLLAAEGYAGVLIDAQLGAAAVHVVRGERRLQGASGELVSLFAVHGPAVGVSSEGLRYALHGETLEPGSSRGLSNVFAADEARVSVERGVLLAIRPSGIVLAGG
jgi:thiamine pyrophosphokinase